MTIRPRSLSILLATFVALGLGASASARSNDSTQHEKITPAFAHLIPNAPGKTITALRVDYKPGGSSISHRHGSAFVIAYVLSGAIRSQLEGGPSTVYHAGESWVEAPGAHHLVSENASKTAPASLLAIFVADSGDKDLVTFDRP